MPKGTMKTADLVNRVFTSVSNDIISAILIEDAFYNRVSDKVEFIKKSSRYSLKTNEECLDQ